MSPGWIRDSCIAGRFVNYQSYWIPNGYSIEIQNSCCAREDPSGVFKNLKIRVFGSLKFKDWVTAICQSGGADVSSKDGHRYVICENKPDSALAGNPKITCLSVEWVIQSLINQRVVRDCSKYKSWD